MSDEKILLVDLCKLVEEKMYELGYTKDGVDRYKKAWAKLQAFSPDKYFNEQVSAEFLKEYCKIEIENPDVKVPKSQLYIFRCVRVLSEYKRFKTFFRKWRVTAQLIVWPEKYAEAMDAYFVFISNYGYSPSWVKRLKRETKRFIEYIDRMGLLGVSEIKGEHISGYIETQIGYSQGEVSAKLVCLKQLFKFLYTNKFHEVNLVLFMPKCRVFPRTKLPTVWEKDDIDKIIASIDRGNPSGKRDYAIIMLAAKLGLRVSDIRNLQLNELNWDNQSIELIQTKTGLPLTLPLLPDVGWAIIDYLKNGRPITTTPNVFVRHQSPFMPFADGGNLYFIITKYISKAGVKVPGKRAAMHSLRNSLATQLLQQNVELPSISGILGHTSIETSRHYLRMDIDSLRKCSLEVSPCLK